MRTKTRWSSTPGPHSKALPPLWHAAGSSRASWWGTSRLAVTTLSTWRLSDRTTSQGWRATCPKRCWRKTAGRLLLPSCKRYVVHWPFIYVLLYTHGFKKRLACCEGLTQLCRGCHFQGIDEVENRHQVQIDICLIFFLHTGCKSVANALHSPHGTEVRSQHHCPKKNSGIVHNQL